MASNESHGNLGNFNHNSSATLYTFIIRGFTEFLDWEPQLKQGDACSEAV